MADILTWNGASRNETTNPKDFFEQMAAISESEGVTSILVLALNDKEQFGAFSNSPDKYEAVFMAEKFKSMAISDDEF